MATQSFADNINSPLSASVETNGYRFTVCATNVNPKVGQSLTITTTLENMSINDVTIAIAAPLVDNNVQVLWRGRQNIGLTRYGMASKSNAFSSLKETLEPGKHVAGSFQINRLFDMSMAGEYEIIVSRWVRSPNGAEWTSITAPPLRITLSEN